jgi:hypothetical protein
MYLFTRVATLGGGGERRSMTWAAEMAALVDERSDHDLTLWRCDFGFPVGTVVWSTWAESLQSLNAGFASLLEDEGYHAMAEKGLEFMSAPPEDSLREVVHGGPTGGEAPPIGAVTTVTTATMAAGKYNDGVAWGVEMAQLVEEVTQAPTTFLLDGYGTFGQVTWLSGAPDAAGADAANAAINGNDKYLAALGDVGTLFEPGSGHRALYTRLA